MAITFEYFINLNERGEFYADVRDETGQTVFEINDYDFFENGYVSNPEDINGLLDFMIEIGIADSSDSIIKG